MINTLRQISYKTLLLSFVVCVGSFGVLFGQAQPTFTYPAAPLGCTTPSQFADPALCTVPGESPLTPFAVPAVGGSYVDSTFGSVVKVISPARTLHGYSTPLPLSATGKYAMLSINNEQTDIVDTASSTVVYRARPGIVTLDQPRWDASSDDIYYFFSGASVVKHVLSTNTTTTLVDYSATGRFTAIKNGGTGDGSKDNWLSFFAPNEHNVCVIDLNSIKTYCADYNASAVAGAIPFTFIDYSLTSRGVDSETGKRLVLLMGLPSLAAFSVNAITGSLQFEYRGAEYPSHLQGAYGRNNGNKICEPNELCLGAPHADVFENTDGKQYLALEMDYEGSSFAPCSRRVTALQLSKGNAILDIASLGTGGGLTSIMATHFCGAGDSFIASHVSCAKTNAYCAFSKNYADYFALDPANPTTPIPRFPHESEVFVVRGLGLEVRRLAQLHSVRFTDDPYWSTARAGLSGDGKFILWDSNFYRSNQEQTVMTSTGMGATVAPPPPTVPPPPTAGVPVTWTNLANVTAIGNSLQGTNAGFNGSASAQQQLASGNGYIDFTVSTYNWVRSVGFSSNASYAQYRITLNGAGAAEVSEFGQYRAGISYSLGDVFRIAVVNGQMNYLKNGVLFASDAIPSLVYPLFVDAFLTSQALLSNVLLSGPAPVPVPPVAQNLVWINGSHVAINGNNLASSNDGYNGSASSQQQVTQGNGFVQFTVAEVNTVRGIGLGHNPGAVDYGLTLNGGGYAEIREFGQYRGAISCATADIFRVAVESGQMKYYKNGTVFQTNTVPTLTYPLSVNAFVTYAATLQSVMFGAF